MGDKPKPSIVESGGSFVLTYPDGSKLRCHNMGTAMYYKRIWVETGKQAS